MFLKMNKRDIVISTERRRYLPKLPANKQFETIFFVLKDVTKRVKRTPHPDIAGKVKIMGDIFESVPSSDWDFSL